MAMVSQFHHEKCGTVAWSARPVGEAADATIVPMPSCVHFPVCSSSDQNGTVSFTAAGEPSRCCAV